MNKYRFINVDYIKEITDGNPELMKEFINLFIQQVPSFYSQMEHYYNTNEYVLLGKLAHKIKNSVAMMGIAELTSDMKRLEKLAQENEKVKSYPTYIKRYKDISEQAITELNTLLSTL